MHSLTHPLHIWQVVQQADSVLRVSLVVFAARHSYPQRPRGHALQHCLIQLLGDERVGQLSQVVLQYSCKVGEKENRASGQLLQQDSEQMLYLSNGFFAA